MLRNRIKNIVKKGSKGNARFGQIADEWLEYKKNMVKQSTYYNYMFIIDKYLKPKYAKAKIKKIKNYNNFVEELTHTLSSKTIRDIVNVLKAILRFYEEEYNCTLNIRKISIPRGEKKKIKVLNKRDRAKLQKFCLDKRDLQSIGIVIALNTGLRIGELCALRWENIDLDEKKIHVKKTMQRIYLENEKRTKVIMDTPKTQSSIREIPINKKLYDVLRPLKKKYNCKDFFLTGSSEKYLEPRIYQNKYKEILKESKVKTCNFHALRHTFATSCIEVGMDAKSLSEILGHANVTITLSRYVHSSEKIKQKYLERLE